MQTLKDIEGAEVEALAALADFGGRRVLEVGAGEGRLTWRYAREAASVLALEPDAESVAAAQREMPPELEDRVRFRAGSALDLDEPPGTFDVAFLSWSL